MKVHFQKLSDLDNSILSIPPTSNQVNHFLSGWISSEYRVSIFKVALRTSHWIFEHLLSCHWPPNAWSTMCIYPLCTLSQPCSYCAGGKHGGSGIRSWHLQQRQCALGECGMDSVHHCAFALDAAWCQTTYSLGNHEGAPVLSVPIALEVACFELRGCLS